MARIPRVQAAPRQPDEVPAPLRRVVRLLGDALGETIAEAGGQDLLADVERLRRACIDLRREPTVAHRETVEGVVVGLGPERAEAVARAFTLWFQLINLAEEHHRVGELAAEGAERGLVHESLQALVAEADDEMGREALLAELGRLRLHPVLTAHPTEARRRAVMECLQRIAGELERLDAPTRAAAEEADLRRRLREEVAVLWRTDQLRREQPSPVEEVRRLMAIFDTSLFRVVPSIYRELDAALDPEGVGARPPAFPAFLRWGSWVGGDRDGNPFVTADVTRHVLDVHADHVLRGLEAVARRISRSLTAAQRATPASAELETLLRALGAAFREAEASVLRRMPNEPHRRALLLVAERVAATRARAEEGYRRVEELVADIDVIQRSLAEGGAPRMAYGELQHLRWQAETFGFHFASLEVRQHSSVHERALAELAPEAVGDAEALDRLATDGWPRGTPEPGDEAHEVLETLRAMADLQRRFGPEACRRHVISFTRSAADVVAVRALARLAVPEGFELDVVPLFETGADLARAVDVLDELVALPGEAARLDARARRLEVMLGYSDSAKDVGFTAANVALYSVQDRCAQWAEVHDVELTLFHGRGGALARGGGPTGRAVRGQAPGSVSGRFKVTEQGEVILNRYRNLALARRHVEQVAHAVVHASAPQDDEAGRTVRDRWLPLAERLAEISRRRYRELVEDPGFAAYFHDVTPVRELARMKLGSRPARRTAGDDIGSLRAIPWAFAWGQSRVNLPGWFGLGAALEAVADDDGVDVLRAMREEWPFFASVVESAEMSLLKADLLVGERYLALGDREDLTEAIIAEYERTERMILEVTGEQRLLDRRPLLRRAVDLRDPYVDALSFLQSRALSRLRADDGDERAEELVRLTINGIAAGLQNTG